MSVSEISANEVFRAMQSPEKREKNPNMTLTPQQQHAVEQASTTSPSLVVAGAGSGKTELMAVRVVWLVANGHAKPQEILGLTFTRKAASELSKRINNGLKELQRSEFWPQELKDQPFVAPNISTYNAYANALFKDHALALGYEPESILLSEASRYKLAREVVVKYGADVDPRLNDLDFSLDSLIGNVLSLASAMSDNQVDADSVNSFIADLEKQISDLPVKGKTESMPIPTTRLKTWSKVFNTSLVANLAQRFIEEKKRRGFVDYSDQVALAVRAVTLMPEEVGGRERSLYKQVLLDEYQDTSTLQTRLLHAIFAEQSVFAVGDPNQSIYGWRGASASNLREYLSTFAKPSQEVKQFPLPTSWRNPTSVLGLANHLLLDLHREPRFITRHLSEDQLAALEQQRVHVENLEAMPNAPEGSISLEFCRTQSEEAELIAKWFTEQFQGKAEEELPTAALLLRVKGTMSTYVEALHRAGLNVEVVGVEGLLQMPEIVDLVAALKVVHYPTAGNQLLRLLTGARWRIGAKDIERLHRFARKVARFDASEDHEVIGEETESSLVDALDQLLELRSYKTGISDEGLERMKDCARLLRTLRRAVGIPLPEFVRVVEHELNLDIELVANTTRVSPMAHLNAFATVVSNYANNHSATLGGFLEWLDYAATKETFDAPSVSATKGVVQVITIHSAKGLEWDAVAVPMLNEGSFPSTTGGNTAWLSMGELPFPLRGDRESLPKLAIELANDQVQLDKIVDDFKRNDVAEYSLREERRLAYVAVTRSRSSLLATGAAWKPGVKNPVAPSVFLTEMAAKLGLPPLADYSTETENPDDKSEVSLNWPMDPLGPQHRPKVEAAAEETRAAMIKPSPTRALEEIELLLRDQDDNMRRAKQARLPVRIPASRFKDFLLETEKVAEDYRRPMPREPFAATMAGTLFHAWVESRFGVFNVNDETEPSTDNDAATNDALDIEDLKEIFERSRFASLTPVDIECEIQVTVRENTFICKIDAVFKTETGYEIVDWKTGISPKTEEEIAEKALQLALYRMAYSKFHGIDPNLIEVCLYYVNEDIEIKPESVKSAEELLDMWSKVLEGVSD